MTKPEKYACPGCGEAMVWDSKNPNRPFCSSSCKDRDFIAWANEEQVIGGNPEYDDVLSEDIKH